MNINIFFVICQQLWLLCHFSIVSSFSFDYTTQSVTWYECPENQQSEFVKECAEIILPLNRDDVAMGNVTAFVRRGYADEVTGNSVWFVAGGPGFSTRTLLPMADFFISSSPSLTIYLLDARGTGLSSPLDCISPPVGAFNPYNSSQLDSYHNCNIDIMARYSTKLQYYTTYDSASDLRDVINLINPTTVSLLGVSYGTYSTNTYMLLPGARYDCVILDGPVPPNSWSIENNAVWNTHVTQDLLNLCVSNSSLCANYLGIVGHIPRLVLDQIVDQTLPCLSKIPWLNTPSGQHWIAIYSNSMTASRTAQSLLGPFYYRLYRCSDSDVAQLINFDQVKQATAYLPQDPLDYSIGYAVNIGVSELYSFSSTPLNYSQQVTQTSRQMSDGSAQFVTSFASDVSSYPHYEVNPATYRTFASPNVPVLILVGTLDPNTEHGLGYYFQSGLGSNATLLSIPYGTHGAISYDTPCVNSIVLSFLLSLGQSYDTSCLTTSPDFTAPDFNGVLQSTKDLSMHFFGTEFLWNNQNDPYLVTNSPTSAPSPLPLPCNDEVKKNEEPSCDYESYEVNKLTVALVIPLCLLVAALAVVVMYLLIMRTKPTNNNSSTFEEKVLL